MARRKESLRLLREEAIGAAIAHTKQLGRKTEGREGYIVILDGSPHAVIEDNGDRGIFQSIGATTANMSIKPTFVATFKDTKPIYSPNQQSEKICKRPMLRITPKTPRLR